MSAALTASFSQAFSRPANIFRKSQASRRPSFLIKSGMVISTRSKVVKRRPQRVQARRRRMMALSLLTRESMTRESLWLQ